MTTPKIRYAITSAPEFCLECFKYRLIDYKCPGKGCGYEFKLMNEPNKKKVVKKLPTKNEIFLALGYKNQRN